ncbi:MAG: hypothetical protein IKF39_02380 [Oscillospiraceae bacterium]|nr:hypothetical protein [Oscillospiraceae bacterium]
MTPREVTINILDSRSIDAAISALDDYSKWLDDKTAEFLERLAIEAVTILEAKVSRLESDTDTVVVPIRYEWKTDGSIDIIADGEQILFLEFGTGKQTYPDTHPEKPPGIVGRGEYGKGHGKWKTWGFYSDENPGRYGWNPRDNTEVILTHGIPAQMPVYETRELIRKRAQEIAKEIFTP